MLRTHSHAPHSGKKPTSAVILLHGLGADGADLVSLGSVWAQHLPDTIFLAPDAPQACDMAPFGYQWFSLQSHSESAILAGVQAAAPVVNTYIEEVLKEYALLPRQIALVGFSQGTMMSLYVAPRRKEQIACVVGYSGMLIGTQTLNAEKLSSPPVLAVHGTNDAVLSYNSLAAVEAGLKAANIPVKTLTCQGLGHGIDDMGVEAGCEFLKTHL